MLYMTRWPTGVGKKATTHTVKQELTIESRRVRVMELLKLGQYTQQEIADMLGVSLATVGNDKRAVLGDWRDTYLAHADDIIVNEAMRINDAIVEINDKIEQIEDNPNWVDKDTGEARLSMPQYDLLNKLYNTRLAHLRALHKVLGLEKVADTNIAIYNDNRGNDDNREHIITVLREKGIGIGDGNGGTDGSETVDGDARILTDEGDGE